MKSTVYNIDNSTFQNNSAFNGGSFFVLDSPNQISKVSNSNFTENKAGFSGGAIML
jgi:hypothetical protein